MGSLHGCYSVRSHITMMNSFFVMLFMLLSVLCNSTVVTRSVEENTVHIRVHESEGDHQGIYYDFKFLEDEKVFKTNIGFLPQPIEKVYPMQSGTIHSLKERLSLMMMLARLKRMLKLLSRLVQI